MSPFDLDQSMQRALLRFGKAPAPSTRARRSDRGVSRLAPAVLACVARVLGGQERPRPRDILSRIEKECRRKGLEPPSRATVYKLMDTVPCPTLRKGDLPPAVQAALYNLVAESRVPAHQVVFCCFNYGDLRAMGFAAGLPWLAIHQALRLPGYREKCRGPLEAVAAERGTGVVVSDSHEVIPAKFGRAADDRILATKLHAILDRGVRRDFFDLYVTLQIHSMGIAECLQAMRTVFRQDLNEPLLLRALTWFEDADREARLPGEGPGDWETVKDFFRTRVGHLLVPPSRMLEIQKRVVDVRGPGGTPA